MIMSQSQKRNTPKAYSLEIVFKTADDELSTMIKSAAAARQAGFINLLSRLYGHAAKSPSFKKLSTQDQAEFVSMICVTVKLYLAAHDYADLNYPELLKKAIKPNHGRKPRNRKKR